jgi:hypothetical protein
MACADEAKEKKKKRFSWPPDLSGNAQRLDLEVLHVTTYFDTTPNAGGCCAGQEVDDEAAFVSSQPLLRPSRPTSAVYRFPSCRFHLMRRYCRYHCI